MKMKATIICGVYAVSVLATPMLAHADAVKVAVDSATATQPKSSSTSSTGTSTSTTPTVNDSANNTNGANSKGQQMSQMVGTILTTTGAAMVASSNPGTVAAGIALIGMGLLSFKQAGAHGKTAGVAGLTGNQSDGYSDLYDTGGGLVDETASSNLTPEASTALKNLEKSGVYNPKTGTLTANGKTYSSSDFASKESMAAAGMPSGLIDGAYAFAEKASKKAEDKIGKIKIGAMTEANGFAEGGGGGSGGAAMGGGDAYAAAAMPGAGSHTGTDGMNGRDPSSLAGMQKNYNGEPIGVAADSIFLMMNRRYKVKDSQESFYTDSELALKK